jgi:hypothetical protein
MNLLKDLYIELKISLHQAAAESMKYWEETERDFVFTTPNSFGRPIRPDSVPQWWNRFEKK